MSRKSDLGLSGPVPQRVPGAVKDKLLAIVEECVAAGWSVERACAVLEVDRRRVWRWQARRDAGVGLDDHQPGGDPIHGLLDWETVEILALAEEWGPVDRSHRKLAHRGSYLQRVWVAPSTVRRVLAAHDVDLPAAAPPGATGAQALARMGHLPAQPGVGLGRDPLHALSGRAQLLRHC